MASKITYSASEISKYTLKILSWQCPESGPPRYPKTRTIARPLDGLIAGTSSERVLQMQVIPAYRSLCTTMTVQDKNGLVWISPSCSTYILFLWVLLALHATTTVILNQSAYLARITPPCFAHHVIKLIWDEMFLTSCLLRVWKNPNWKTLPDRESQKWDRSARPSPQYIYF